MSSSAAPRLATAVFALSAAFAHAAPGAAAAAADTQTSRASPVSMTAAAATTAASLLLTLQPAQVAALGLRTAPAKAAASGAATRYPATLLTPSAQQRVLAAPLPALVTALGASVGDTVRAGQLLAVLQSGQMRELHHDLHVARSAEALSSSQLARDQRLFQEGLIAATRLETTRAQAALAREQVEEREQALAQSGGAARGDTSRITLTAPISGVVLERPVVLGQRVEGATPLFRLATLGTLWLEAQVPAAAAAQVRLGDLVQLVPLVDGDAAPGASLGASTGTAPGTAPGTPAGTTPDNGSAAAASATGGAPTSTPASTSASSPTSAKVSAIGHAVDPASQTVLVRATLSTVPPHLRAGQAVEVALQRSLPGLVQVPEAALVQDEGRSVVFVAEAAGRYRVQPVTAVASSAGLSTVRGLAVGEQVVVQGTAALKSLRAAQRP